MTPIAITIIACVAGWFAFSAALVFAALVRSAQISEQRRQQGLEDDTGTPAQAYMRAAEQPPVSHQVLQVHSSRHG